MRLNLIAFLIVKVGITRDKTNKHAPVITWFRSELSPSLSLKLKSTERRSYGQEGNKTLVNGSYWIDYASLIFSKNYGRNGITLS